MTSIRPAAVAGMFYPDDPGELHAAVTLYLSDAKSDAKFRNWTPKAIIVPHAGYIYSATVAAPAYDALRGIAGRIRRVVLLGPNHRVPLNKIAAPSVDAFATPNDEIPIDSDAIAAIVDLQQVEINDEPHTDEHSLEVHLPFLREVLGDFMLVPLVVGTVDHKTVAQVLKQLWGGDETLIVISTDLSHFNDYDQARQLDLRTAEAIEALQPDAISQDGACGRIAVGGLLRLAKEIGLKIERLGLQNSGDTAGPRDRVVGYGSWILG
jgi:MEMO1 family protein